MRNQEPQQHQVHAGRHWYVAGPSEATEMLTIFTACEAYRHIDLLENGYPVPQETRGFNEDRQETYKLRSKEDAPDYRYMPDPNLPPLLLTDVRLLKRFNTFCY